jgi:polysaccharide deacetylase 2 family uncharacterized protein YibQ
MRRHRARRRRTTSRNEKTKWIKGILLVVTFFLIVYMCINLFRMRRPKEGLKEQEVEQLVRQIGNSFQILHIQEKWQTRFGSTITVRIPSKNLVDDVVPLIQKEVATAGAEIIQITPDTSFTQIVLSIGRNGQISFQYVFIVDPSIVIARARAAIIVDDFGYNYNSVAQEFILFPQPVTLSILPGLTESEHIAQMAVQAGKQYLIHMPMEPLNEQYSKDDYILLADYDGATIRSRIRKAFAVFPAAAGMNNHQGSKFTSMAIPIEIALDEIKKHDKLFIDSRTSPASLAYQTARRLGLRAGENNLFIDARDDDEFISQQIHLVIKTALQRGKVIAIGHVRFKTLNGLSRALDDFRQNGVEMVYVSELVQ